MNFRPKRARYLTSLSELLDDDLAFIETAKFVSTNFGTCIEIELEAVIRRPQVLDEVTALQARADRLQDELDEFNATTKIEIELDE